MSILEMKVPSPGESITEVEIATWLVKDGDYVEKDQPIAEVDSDKATLELPAEESGIITLKAEEGDVVQVGQVVCLIDMSAAKPEGSAAPVAEAPKAEAPKVEEKKEEPNKEAPVAATYASNTPSPAAKKILDEKGMEPAQVQGTGRDGRITKDDAVKAVPAMGSASSTNGSRAQTTTKLSVL
ncbi:biotin/lipoyl-containing protein, partial [Soonwooa sp.]